MIGQACHIQICAMLSLGRFATDLDDEDLRKAIHSAYKNFSDPGIAPLVRLNENWQVLELFHGPTLAFKDFALQLLGNLYELQITRTGKKLCVLGATSGDTGAAAISGLLGKSGVKVFILYPDGKVSPLQERQMTCTGAENVFPLAIEGTFDDAQRTVKELFGDLAFREFDWLIGRKLNQFSPDTCSVGILFICMVAIGPCYPKPDYFCRTNGKLW